MALGRLLLVVLMLSLVSLPALALESVAPGEQGVALTDFPSNTSLMDRKRKTTKPFGLSLSTRP